MTEYLSIETTAGSFDAIARGPEDGRPVMLLHGFPQATVEWDHQVAELGGAGFRAVAPDQRGYSPAVRPEHPADYRIETLVDDLSGKEISEGTGETITFAVNGKQYSIDLDDKNATKFHAALEPYIQNATKLGRGSVTQMRRSKKNDDLDLSEVRSWAEDNGYEVSSRGRVRGEIIDAYKAANG